RPSRIRWRSSTLTRIKTRTRTRIRTKSVRSGSVKCPASIALGTVLLAAVGAAAFVAAFIAASYRPAARSAELENFHLVGPAGRSYSIESFPSGAVLAIYFGFTTCQRSCPTALNNIAEAVDRLGKLGAAVQPVFIDMDPERAAVVSIPAYTEAFGPG